MAFGNSHFAPEGAMVEVINTNTGKPADIGVFDRATGLPIAAPDYAHGAGPGRECAHPRSAMRAARSRRAPHEHPSRAARRCRAGRRAAQPAMNPRTRALLQGPIVPTLLRMAWPNVLVMVAQAATGLIETYWVGKLGTDALAGMALVFPGVMLMQMFSAGAMGGGISSAIARALGAGKRDEADALVLHALVINLALGAAFTVALLLFGPAALPRDGRRGRLARSGADLFQHRVRRHRAAVGDERARERDPRHRQHAGPGAGDLRRRGRCWCRSRRC